MHCMYPADTVDLEQNSVVFHVEANCGYLIFGRNGCIYFLLLLISRFLELHPTIREVENF